jgi:hypothetical protein
VAGAITTRLSTQTGAATTASNGSPALDLLLDEVLALWVDATSYADVCNQNQN